MESDPIDKDFGDSRPPIPPSYEQCVAAPAVVHADRVVEPLEMASLLAWDEDEDDEY